MSVRATLLAVTLASVAGCTAVRKESRRTMTGLDDHLTPSSPTVRACLLPVAIPVGFAALLADTFVVNPAYALDDAWLDTVDLLWTPRDESPLRRALFTPFAALATPVVFGGDWLGRCVFPLPARKEDEDAKP